MSVKVTKTIKTYENPNPYSSDKSELANSPLVRESQAQMLSTDLFKKFDANKNGRLGPQELKNFNEYVEGEFNKSNAQHLQPGNIFSTAEIDSDGGISRSEFDRWVKIHMTYPNHLVDTVSLEKWSNSGKNPLIGSSKGKIIDDDCESSAERERRRLLSGSVAEGSTEEVVKKVTTTTEGVDPVTGKNVVKTTVEEEIIVKDPSEKAPTEKLTISNYTNGSKPKTIVETKTITTTPNIFGERKPIVTKTKTEITQPMVKKIESYPRRSPITIRSDVSRPATVNPYPIRTMEGSRRLRPIQNSTINLTPTSSAVWDSPVQKSYKETVTIENSGRRSWTRPEPPIIIPEDAPPSISRGYTPSPDKEHVVTTKVYEGESRSTVFRPPEGTYKLVNQVLAPGSHYKLPHGGSYIDSNLVSPDKTRVNHMRSVTPTSYNYSQSRVLNPATPLIATSRSPSPAYITNRVETSPGYRIQRTSNYSPVINPVRTYTNEKPYNLTSQTSFRPSNQTATTDKYIIGGLNSTISFSPNKLRKVSQVSDTATLNRSFITPTRASNVTDPRISRISNTEHSFIPSSYRNTTHHERPLTKVVEQSSTIRSISPSPTAVIHNQHPVYTATLISNGVRKSTPITPVASYTQLSPERVIISPERVWREPNKFIDIEPTKEVRPITTTRARNITPVTPTTQVTTTVVTEGRSPIEPLLQEKVVGEPTSNTTVVHKRTIEPSIFNAPSTVNIETTPKNMSYKTHTGDRTVYAAYQTPSNISTPYREKIHPSRIRKGDPYEVSRTPLGVGTPVKSYSVVDDSNPKTFKTRDENFEYNTEILKRNGYVETAPTSAIKDGSTTRRVQETTRFLTPTSVPVSYQRTPTSHRSYISNFDHNPGAIVTTQAIDGNLLGALNRTFDRYDVNNSQFIEKDEIPALMKDTYYALGYHFEPNEADVDSYLRNMDLSKDGLISRDEFVTVCTKSLRERGIIA